MFGIRRKPKQPPPATYGTVIYKPGTKKTGAVRRSRLAALKLPSTSSLRRFVIGTGTVVIVGALFIGSRSILISPAFSVTDFEFFGNRQVTKNILNQELAKFKGKSIFLLRDKDISDYLLSTHIYFKDITVKKFLPNKIRITFTEREPYLSIINLDGAFLVDKDGTVLDQLVRDKINFNSDDLDIIRGFGDPNASYVLDRLQQEAKSHPTPTPTTTPSPSPGALTPTPDPAEMARRQAELEAIRRELLDKVQQQLDTFGQALSQTAYASIPRVYVYENTQYKKNDSIDQARLGLTGDISSFFGKSDIYLVQRIIWEGAYLIDVQLVGGQEIIFGTQRKSSEQLEDFALVASYLKLNGKGFSSIDVSSQKVSVK